MIARCEYGYTSTPLSELDRKKYKLAPIDEYSYHEYVPDFAMVLRAANTFYLSISTNVDTREGKNLCPWGNLLYNIYAHMSIVVKLCARKSPRYSPFNRSLQKAQRMFEATGFNNSKLFSYSCNWAQGLGEHCNSELGVTIRPSLGDPDEDLIAGTGFWNKSSAELLPNVKMAIKGALVSTEVASSSPSLSDIASKLEDYSGLKNVALELIPGFSDILIAPLAEDLKTRLLERTEQEETLLRYLCMDQDLLLFLSKTYSPFYSKTKNNVKLYNLPLRGTELGMLSCVETSTPKISYRQELEPVDADEICYDEGQTLYTVKKVAELNLPSHRARICSRTKNELVQYARHFPLVRIVSPHNRIFEDSGRPHSDWFYSGFNFQTDEFDLDNCIDNLSTTWEFLTSKQLLSWY